LEYSLHEHARAFVCLKGPNGFEGMHLSAPMLEFLP